MLPAAALTTAADLYQGSGPSPNVFFRQPANQPAYVMAVDRGNQAVARLAHDLCGRRCFLYQ